MRALLGPTLLVSLFLLACGPEAPPATPPGDGPVDSPADAGEAIPPDAGDTSCRTLGCPDPALPQCDAATGTCAACLEDPHCPADRYCADKLCVPGCHSDLGCVGSPAGAGRCDIALHTCVRCAADSHCASGEICRDAQCVTGCRDDQDCAQGLSCCDNRCVDLKSSVASCGSCTSSCEAEANMEATCSDSTCQPATCVPGYLDCDGKADTGCEIFTPTDAAHCGACDKACVTGANVASVACVQAACVPECEPGFANCDGDPANGCEVNLLTDAASCGSCGFGCQARPGTSAAACAAGLCARGPCAPGRDDCDGNPANGCEVDVLSDMAHCGGCAKPCGPFTNMTAACSAGVCEASCVEGFLDCDDDRATGCEDVLGTLSDCRSCNESCAVPNGAAAATCSATAGCGFTCPTGRAECDGNAATACEVDTTSSTLHCGGCSRACPVRAHADTTCAGSQCGFTCIAPWADCDGDPSNGCETNTDTDSAHCGSCPASCSGSTAQICVGGQCEAANCNAAHLHDCDGDTGNGCETDVRSSVDHCGACNGGCSAPANAEATCANGQCGFTCNAPFFDCDGNPANGCETDGSSDVNACGACGHKCAFSNAAASCVNGQCVQGACEAPFLECSASAEGCETNGNDLSSCGACGRACSVANGTPRCASGSCEVAACNPGFANCDGKPDTGCEQSLNTVQACGACGSPCQQNHGVVSCESQRCVIKSCEPGFGNCNASAWDGCEQALNVPGHCGGCYATPQEVCDKVDNDCDGLIDEGCPIAVGILAPTGPYNEMTDAAIGPYSAATSFSSRCGTGRLGIGQGVWATIDTFNPFMTGIELYCALPELEQLSPTSFRIRPNGFAVSQSVGFSGAAYGDQRCPYPKWLTGSQVRWQYSPSRMHGIEKSYCTEAFVELTPEGWKVRFRNEEAIGPSRGWMLNSSTYLGREQDMMVFRGVHGNAGWYVTMLAYEVRAFDITQQP